MLNFCGFIRSMKLFLMVDGYNTYICTSAWSVSSVYSTTIGRARYWESQVSGESGIGRAMQVLGEPGIGRAMQVSGEPGIGRARYRESQVSGEPGITSGSQWLDIYLEGFGHVVIFLIPCVLNVHDWSRPQRRGTPPPPFVFHTYSHERREETGCYLEASERCLCPHASSSPSEGCQGPRWCNLIGRKGRSC